MSSTNLTTSSGETPITSPTNNSNPPNNRLSLTTSNSFEKYSPINTASEFSNNINTTTNTSNNATNETNDPSNDTRTNNSESNTNDTNNTTSNSANDAINDTNNNTTNNTHTTVSNTNNTVNNGDSTNDSTNIASNTSNEMRDMRDHIGNPPTDSLDYSPISPSSSLAFSNIPFNPVDSTPNSLSTTPAALRRRTTSRKRSNSSATRLQMGVDPQIDYILGLSLSLKRFVGNPLFHDVLLICAEENVYAHKVIVRKRSPNFFFVLAKSALNETINMSSNTAELVFHFDDITKGAMLSLMEYIYCGGFHSKVEAEDAWVMYNFVIKHGIICPGLKEKACYQFYNSLSPENLLDIFALNRYGFTINTLPYNPADSARYSARDNKEGSPSESPTVSRNNMGSISPTTTTTATATTPTTPPSPKNPNPNLIPNTYHSNNNNDTNYRASINLPGGINRNSISINRAPNPASPSSSPSFNSANQEILLSLLKYASKKGVMKYVTKHTKKNPTLKQLQSELRKYKTDPETDVSRLWKDRQREVKAFAKRKKLQPADSFQKQQSEVGRRN